MKSMSRFFYEKTAWAFRRFSRCAKQSDGGSGCAAFVGRRALGSGAGGAGVSSIPANALALAFQSSRTVRGCIALAEVAQLNK